MRHTTIGRSLITNRIINFTESKLDEPKPDVGKMFITFWRIFVIVLNTLIAMGPIH